MALLINDECISCGVCADNCPNDAIAEGDAKYIINPDRCTECVGAADEPQCATDCPVEACVPDPKHKESKAELEAKYKKLHG